MPHADSEVNTLVRGEKRNVDVDHVSVRTCADHRIVQRWSDVWRGLRRSRTGEWQRLPRQWMAEDLPRIGWGTTVRSRFRSRTQRRPRPDSLDDLPTAAERLLQAQQRATVERAVLGHAGLQRIGRAVAAAAKVVALVAHVVGDAVFKVAGELDIHQLVAEWLVAAESALVHLHAAVRIEREHEADTGARFADHRQRQVLPAARYGRVRTVGDVRQAHFQVRRPIGIAETVTAGADDATLQHHGGLVVGGITKHPLDETAGLINPHPVYARAGAADAFATVAGGRARRRRRAGGVGVGGVGVGLTGQLQPVWVGAVDSRLPDGSDGMGSKEGGASGWKDICR
eukprot:ctg_126.g72